MGSRNITYQAPKIEKDTSFQDYLKYQQEREAKLDARAEQERLDREAEALSLRKSKASGLPAFYQRLENQLKSGAIGIGDATSSLQSYIDVNKLGGTFSPVTTTTDTGVADDPNTEVDESKSTTTTTFSPGYEDPTKGASQYLDKLNTLVSGEDGTGGLLKKQRTAQVNVAFQNLLGRQPTASELTQNLGLLSGEGGLQLQDIRDNIKSSAEYTKKFNDNYLDNYYDTLYGKQTVDEEGNRTKKRTFTFDASLLPTYGADLADRTKVDITTGQEFSDYFAEGRSIEELKEGQQNIRETRQFIFSSGLKELQGTIDKETQKIKNQGAKDIARINQGTSMYNLLGGFRF